MTKRIIIERSDNSHSRNLPPDAKKHHHRKNLEIDIQSSRIGISLVATISGRLRELNYISIE